ncbi:MAG TPA: tetratricopeptide repeat protein, partial [Planctomycetota bacterium]|nr:tetratricopeptide repeat protein [Planctomycetota bacterium]
MPKTASAARDAETPRKPVASSPSPGAHGRRFAAVAALALVAAAGVVFMTVRRGGNEPPPLPETLQTLAPEIRTLIQDKRALAAERRGDVRAFVDYALAMHFNGLYQDSYRAFVRLAELDPKNPLPVHYQGHCHREMGDLDAAFDAYDRVANRHATFAPAWYERGRLNLDRGDLDAAERDLAKACELAPQTADPWIGAGDLANKKRDFAKAKERLDRALALDPVEKTALYQMGVALRGLGRREEAERKLIAGTGASARRMPDEWSKREGEFSRSVSSLTSTAIHLMQTGKPREGVALLERLQRDHPKNIEVLVNLGGAYQDAGQYEKAKTVFLRALEMSPGKDAVLINLASVHLNLKDDKAALEWADKAIKVAPEQAHAHANRGYALMRLKRPQEATESYRKAVKY